LNIRFNILFPSKPRTSKWSLSITSSNQNPVCTPRVFCSCHIPRPSHSTWFNYRNNQIITRYRNTERSCACLEKNRFLYSIQGYWEMVASNCPRPQSLLILHFALHN
jgi:hypothetical protein